MKKLTALLLAAAMLLGLGACATMPEETIPSTTPITQPSVPVPTDPPTQPTVTEPEPTTAPTEPDPFDPSLCAPLFGTWKTTVTMDKELLNMSYFYKKVTFDLYYTFREDGTYAVHADETKFQDAIEKYETLMIDHMVERRYTTYKADMERDGYSQSRIDKLWAEGAEAEARTDSEAFMVKLDLFGKFSQLLRQGRYYVQDGRVFLEQEDGTFESDAFAVKNSKLTLSETNNRSLYGMLCIGFPLTLTAEN